MPFLKRLSLCLLALSLLLPSVIPAQAEQVHAQPAMQSLPSISAASAILLELESGTVLLARSPDDELPMASTTKIMTALVALSLCSTDTVIRVSKDAVGVEGSSVYLFEGEELTLEQLLYAMLLESANDAAAAIAIGISGSVEQFADEMNAMAASLGLSHTHFTNPHGLDHEEHYTTAAELAKIAQAAMKNEIFRTIVSTRKTTIPHAGTDGVRLLINHNKLLRSYDGCIGLKTGYTKRSGRCLVSCAERNGVSLLVVTLDDPNDWRDHASLFDYGFSRLESVVLCDAGGVSSELPVVGGMTDFVSVSNSDALRVTLPVGHGEITSELILPHFLFASVNEGEKVGEVKFYCDGTLLGRLPLVATSACERLQKKSFWDWLKALFGF